MFHPSVDSLSTGKISFIFIAFLARSAVPHIAYAQQIITFQLKESKLTKHKVDGTEKSIMMSRKFLATLFLDFHSMK